MASGDKQPLTRCRWISWAMPSSLRTPARCALWAGALAWVLGPHLSRRI